MVVAVDSGKVRLPLDNGKPCTPWVLTGEEEGLFTVILALIP